MVGAVALHGITALGGARLINVGLRAMEAAFYDVLPVVAVAAIGYLAVRFGLVSQAANDGISRFVFAIVLPTFIFRNLMYSNIAGNIQFIWKVLASYYLGAALVLVLGIAVAYMVLKAGKSEQQVIGVGASHANVVLLGVPALLLITDGKAAIPLILIVGLHTLLMAIILTTVSRVQAGRVGEVPQAIWHSLIGQAKNPIFIALVAGALYSVLDLPRFPNEALKILNILSDAVIPASLFALGGMMVRYNFSGEAPEAMTAAALKLVAHPLIVLFLAKSVFGLNTWAIYAALLAAMPAGFNMHNMASRSQGGAAMASTAIVLSTLASIVTIVVFLDYF